MYIKTAPLKPLSGLSLTSDESILLKWLRNVHWDAVRDAREPTHRAKVPQYYSGVQLYRMQAGGAPAGALGALEIFIKKLAIHDIIAKQGLYPVEGHGQQARYLSLKKADMENLGIGKEADDED